MSAKELASLLLADASFRADLRTIMVETAASELPVDGLAFGVADRDWFRLMRYGSIFMESDDESHRDVGLRLAHGCLASDAPLSGKAVAAALLAKAASTPTLKVAVRQDLIPDDILERLPPRLLLDVDARQIAATLNIDAEGEFIGNEFQGDLWRALAGNDWISASAPTSAGKSFVLEKWIEHATRTMPGSTTFYVVPTRALVSQVESSLRDRLSKSSADVAISSLPLALHEPAAHRVFVYTQERLHLYLQNNALDGSVDLIVIDEAQQIGANRRGILLQQVLELTAKTYPDAKVLFASPSTRNPECLLQFAPPGKRTRVITGSKPTVSQNLVWVESTPGKPKRWALNLMIDETRAPIRTIELENRPSDTQKLPFIAHAVGGKSGGNVIYVNRAFDAEEVAEILAGFEGEDSVDPELIALSKLCRTAVHPRFKLRRHVLRGVAFHYGNMPQLIRTEIERLFSSGKIRFLVCTSTLVEGVNLSCKNIFLRNPRRGLKDLMSSDDFWNLAGRAGRWGMEFQGNIYCIDPTKKAEWIGGEAPRSKKKHSIRIATQSLASEFTSFMNYIRASEEMVDPKLRFYEHLLTYLVFRRVEYGELAGAPALSGLSDSQLSQLTDAIDHTIKNLGLPVEIALRNPGINPWGLRRLADYFREKPDDKLEELAPVDPLSDTLVEEPPEVGAELEEVDAERRGSGVTENADDAKPDEESDGDADNWLREDSKNWDAVVANLLAIFTRMSKYLGASLGSGITAYGNAKLVSRWMRGYPLNQIIDEQIRYWAKKAPQKRDTAVIRETLERVEKIARFEAPRYLHAYLDVLGHVLAERGREDLAQSTDEFWLYLEFGVFKRTQLSLMAIGLSRSSAIALTRIMRHDDFSETECIAWLTANPWDEFDLPRLAEIEIGAALARRRGKPLSTA